MKFLGFANQQKSDSGLGCSSCPPFYLNCRRFVRLFPTGARGEAATLRPPTSVCRRLRCSSCRARRFWPTSARWRKATARSNCRTLFGIGRIPSDNYIRDFLDEADPALLQPCFERMEALLSEPPMRQAFGSARRKDPDRLGRNGVLLLAETRLPALPDAQARPARPRAIILCCRRRS